MLLRQACHSLTRARERIPGFFTVASTVGETFAAKLRNSAKRHENEFGVCPL
jgi:hypothetical protein